MKALMRIILSHRWVGGHRGSMGWGHEGVFQVARCRTWSSGRLGIELEWVSRVTAAVERERERKSAPFLFFSFSNNAAKYETDRKEKKGGSKKRNKTTRPPTGFLLFFSSFHLWSGRWNNRRFFFYTFYGFILFVFYLFFFGGGRSFLIYFKSISFTHLFNYLFFHFHQELNHEWKMNSLRNPRWGGRFPPSWIQSNRKTTWSKSSSRQFHLISPNEIL